MRPMGFSTGALAYSDFRRGLAMMRGKSVRAVELSALRQAELIPLLDALDSLDLSGFAYVSIHAPSEFEANKEAALWLRLQEEAGRSWPIILHPDAILDFGLWRELGSAVCVENMDKRKLVGRSARELEKIFEELPRATFCFDIGHARQFDSTMTEAYLLLTEFGSRLRQVHVSEVNARSKHDPLSYTSVLAFREVAHLVPESVPLILETPVSETEMENELAKVRDSLPVNQSAMVA
jgi:hypothetical protein